MTCHAKEITMNNPLTKIYVTKYALTSGPFSVMAKIEGNTHVGEVSRIPVMRMVRTFGSPKKKPWQTANAAEMPSWHPSRSRPKS